MLPLLACAAGVYLGLHFNVLVMLPFSALGAGALMFSLWASGHAFPDSAGLLLVPMIAIQAGYMVGLTARDSYEQLLARLNIGQSERV